MELKTLSAGGLVPLTPVQLDAWHKFQAVRDEKERSGAVLLLYRGTRMRDMRRNSSPDFREENKVFEAFFQLGDKARRMLADQADLRWGVNEFSKDVCRAIVRQISDAIASSEMRMRALLSCVDFFRQNYAGDQLHDVIATAYKSDLGRMRVRDYYLFLLHTLGVKGIRSGSPLLSTSVSKEVARRFSHAHHEKHGAILGIFVPHPIEHWVVAPWKCMEISRRVAALGLPVFSPMGAYPEQAEISLKGGALPHFVSHVELRDGQVAVVNPAIFEASNQRLESVFKHGLSIDQSRFFHFLEDSGYSRYVEADSSGKMRERTLS